MSSSENHPCRDAAGIFGKADRSGQLQELPLACGTQRGSIRWICHAQNGERGAGRLWTLVCPSAVLTPRDCPLAGRLPSGGLPQQGTWTGCPCPWGEQIPLRERYKKIRLGALECNRAAWMLYKSLGFVSPGVLIAASVPGAASQSLRRKGKPPRAVAIVYFANCRRTSKRGRSSQVCPRQKNSV